MPVIEWRDELLTGDSVIDAQHRALFKMTNDLHDALLMKRSDEFVQSLLFGLERYCIRHFDAEQQLMEASGYLGGRAHLKQHEDIAKRTREIVEAHQTNKMSLGITVTQTLGRWLTEHILNEDKRMVQWSRLNGGLAAASGHFPMRDSPKELLEKSAEPAPRVSSTQRVTSPNNWAARDSLRQLVAASDLLGKK